MYLDSKNEDLTSGTYDYTVTEINTDDRKNFYVWGNELDNSLTLKNVLARDNGALAGYKDNPNIYYDGGAGDDTLSYEDTDDNRVDVYLSSKDGYDLNIDGGMGDANSGRQELEPDDLDVFITNVEYLELTQKNDNVWLEDLTEDLGIVIDGGDGDDEMYGGSASDYFVGGDGDDTLEGNDGDDVLVADGGGDVVSGGAGTDVIYVQVDLDSDNSHYVYGDYVSNGNGGYEQNGDVFNEEDIFIVGYDSGYSETTVGGNFWDTFTDMSASSLIDTTFKFGSIFLEAAGTSKYTSAVGYYGATFATDMAYGLITGGIGMDQTITVDDNVESQIFIEDFDPWADSVVIALDEYADYVSADNAYTADGMRLDFELQGQPFLSLNTAESHLSVMEDDTDLSISESRMNDILENTLLNSVKVWTDDDGHLHAETLNGIDFLEGLSEGDEAYDALAALVTEGSEGVWMLGNYGGGMAFGNGKTGLAGSNSADLLYAGTYDSSSTTSAFLVATDIAIFGGEGNDTIFGSTSDYDTLHGGEDDDHMYVVGGTENEIYGGSGDDVASFATIEFENNGESVTIGNGSYGVKVDLTDDDTGGLDGVNAYYWDGGSTQGRAAILYDIEGIEGTDMADILIGDSGSNTIVGNGGNDSLTGNGGENTFYFASDSGSDTITDFGSDDTLIFQDLTEDAYNDLVAAVDAGETTLDYGANSLNLSGFDTSGLSLDVTEEDDLFDVTLYTYEETTTSTGGGGTVICTHMHERGYISDAVYAWDAVYGARLGEDVLRGYHAWAIPLVERVLKKSEIATQIVRPFACAWAQEMAHRCDPIAHPKGARLGRAILGFGVPLCRGLGKVLKRGAEHSTQAA